MLFRGVGFIWSLFLEEGHCPGRRPASNGLMKTSGTVYQNQIYCHVASHIQGVCVGDLYYKIQIEYFCTDCASMHKEYTKHKYVLIYYLSFQLYCG